MNVVIKRMRVFAGPNGSGKSTILQIVKDNHVRLGVYCNADDYKRGINTTHYFDFNSCGLNVNYAEFENSFSSSSLFKKADGERVLSASRIDGGRLLFETDFEVNDYFTSFLCAYVRNELIANGCSKFTFETVMSHPSKLDFMMKAKEKGYKVYLYFISLTDPSLNVKRVKSRVLQGGHDVPEEKIKERYNRTMDNLLDAILIADKSYIFDNSRQQPVLFATVEKQQLHIADSTVPIWFNKYVINKL